MNKTVKVIWDGARKFGVALSPGETQFFLPGLNEIDAAVWKRLTGDKGCTVNHHLLKGGLLRLASEEVQSGDDIGKMTAVGAIEVVTELMDEGALNAAREQEQGRKDSPRKTVMDAIDERAGMFEKLKEDPDGGDSEAAAS